jgi:hypothetical protein
MAIAAPVQMFTAWRIKIITESWIIPIIISFFSVIAFAAATMVSVQVATFKLLATKLTWRFNAPGVAWFVGAAISDIVITVSLCYSLVSSGLMCPHRRG